MFNLFQQFIAAKKRISEELHEISVSLHDIQKSLNKNTEAISKAAESGDKKEDTPPPIIELRFPKSIQTRTVLDSKQNEPMEWIKLSLGLTTLIAIIAYTTLSAYQLIEMKNAAETAHDALVSNDRAWVGQSGPIKVNFILGIDKRPTAEIYLRLVNFGHSPAKLVFHSSAIVEHENLRAAAESTCNFAKAEAGFKIPSMISSGTGRCAKCIVAPLPLSDLSV
jgi:hypothetical protein